MTHEHKSRLLQEATTLIRAASQQNYSEVDTEQAHDRINWLAEAADNLAAVVEALAKETAAINA